MSHFWENKCVIYCKQGIGCTGLSTSCPWVNLHAPQHYMKVSGQLQSLAVLPQRNNPQIAPKWRLNESKSQSWRFGETSYPHQVKNNDAQFLEIHSLVTMLTKLSWLRHREKLHSQDSRFSASIFTAHVVSSLGTWGLEEVPVFFLTTQRSVLSHKTLFLKKLLTSSPDYNSHLI